VNPPSGPALHTSKVSTYLQWHSSRGNISTDSILLHINLLHLIFQNLSCHHLCIRFVQTSFAVSVWSCKYEYLWSIMFTNHSLFWRIILENGTRRSECEWRSVWRKCQILAITTSQREVETPSPLHYNAYEWLFYSDVKYWKWSYLLFKNETQSQQTAVRHLKPDRTLSTGLYNLCCTNCWIVYRLAREYQRNTIKNFVEAYQMMWLLSDRLTAVLPCSFHFTCTQQSTLQWMH
jgi:hypothetical protein